MASLLCMAWMGCSSQKEGTRSVVEVPEHAFVQARRPIIVYRTSADYTQFVPVSLNAQGQLLSYPAPTDVNEMSVPVQLKNGYLYDRRGIGQQVAFTSYTYEAYMQLSRVPSHEELLQSVVDKDPLVEMWDCSTIYRKMAEKQGGAVTAETQIALLNQIIDSGFEGCKMLVSPKK